MNVKSGECIVMTMITKYLHNVKIAYNATGTLKDTSNTIDNYQLLSLAKQVIENPVHIDSNSNTKEVTFTISGEIKADLAVDSYTYAENCDFV